MADRVLVVIGTGERAKAQAGEMYAVNALRHGWLEDVKLVFFGPAEALLLDDEDLQEFVREYHRLEDRAVACRFLSDREGTSADLADLGLDVAYVGPLVSQLIREGYVPMVW